MLSGIDKINLNQGYQDSPPGHDPNVFKQVLDDSPTSDTPIAISLWRNIWNTESQENGPLCMTCPPDPGHAKGLLECANVQRDNTLNVHTGRLRADSEVAFLQTNGNLVPSHTHESLMEQDNCSRGDSSLKSTFLSENRNRIYEQQAIAISPSTFQSTPPPMVLAKSNNKVTNEKSIESNGWNCLNQTTANAMYISRTFQIQPVDKQSKCSAVQSTDQNGIPYGVDAFFSEQHENMKSSVNSQGEHVLPHKILTTFMQIPANTEICNIDKEAKAHPGGPNSFLKAYENQTPYTQIVHHKEKQHSYKTVKGSQSLNTRILGKRRNLESPRRQNKISQAPLNIATHNVPHTRMAPHKQSSNINYLQANCASNVHEEIVPLKRQVNAVSLSKGNNVVHYFNESQSHKAAEECYQVIKASSNGCQAFPSHSQLINVSSHNQCQNPSASQGHGASLSQRHGQVCNRGTEMPPRQHKTVFHNQIMKGWHSPQIDNSHSQIVQTQRSQNSGKDELRGPANKVSNDMKGNEAQNCTSTYRSHLTITPISMHEPAKQSTHEKTTTVTKALGFLIPVTVNSIQSSFKPGTSHGSSQIHNFSDVEPVNALVPRETGLQSAMPLRETGHQTGLMPSDIGLQNGIMLKETGHQSGLMPIQTGHQSGLMPTEKGHQSASLRAKANHQNSLISAERAHLSGLHPTETGHQSGLMPIETSTCNQSGLMPRKTGHQSAPLLTETGHQSSLMPRETGHYSGLIPAETGHIQSALRPRETSPQSGYAHTVTSNRSGMMPRVTGHWNALLPKEGSRQSGLMSGGTGQQSGSTPRESAHQNGLFLKHTGHQSCLHLSSETGDQSSLRPRETVRENGLMLAETGHQSGLNPTEMSHQRGSIPTATGHQRGIISIETGHQNSLMPRETSHQRSLIPTETGNHTGLLTTEKGHQRGLRPREIDHQSGLMSIQPVTQHSLMPRETGHPLAYVARKEGHDNAVMPREESHLHANAVKSRESRSNKVSGPRETNDYSSLVSNEGPNISPKTVGPSSLVTAAASMAGKVDMAAPDLKAAPTKSYISNGKSTAEKITSSFISECLVEEVVDSFLKSIPQDMHNKKNRSKRTVTRESQEKLGDTLPVNETAPTKLSEFQTSKKSEASVLASSANRAMNSKGNTAQVQQLKKKQVPLCDGVLCKGISAYDILISDSELYKCGLCDDLVFESPFALIGHFVLKHSNCEILPCPHCHIQVDKYRIIRHYDVRHKYKEGLRFFCGGLSSGPWKCFASFDSLYKLWSHTKCHEDQTTFHCELCEKTFQTNRSFVLHHRSVLTVKEGQLILPPSPESTSTNHEKTIDPHYENKSSQDRGLDNHCTAKRSNDPNCENEMPISQQHYNEDKNCMNLTGISQKHCSNHHNCANEMSFSQKQNSYESCNRINDISMKQRVDHQDFEDDSAMSEELGDTDQNVEKEIYNSETHNPVSRCTDLENRIPGTGSRDNFSDPHPSPKLKVEKTGSVHTETNSQIRQAPVFVAVPTKRKRKYDRMDGVLIKVVPKVDSSVETISVSPFLGKMDELDEILLMRRRKGSVCNEAPLKKKIKIDNPKDLSKEQLSWSLPASIKRRDQKRRSHIKDVVQKTTMLLTVKSESWMHFLWRNKDIFDDDAAKDCSNADSISTVDDLSEVNGRSELNDVNLTDDKSAIEQSVTSEAGPLQLDELDYTCWFCSLTYNSIVLFRLHLACHSSSTATLVPAGFQSRHHLCGLCDRRLDSGSSKILVSKSSNHESNETQSRTMDAIKSCLDGYYSPETKDYDNQHLEECSKKVLPCDTSNTHYHCNGIKSESFFSRALDFYGGMMVSLYPSVQMCHKNALVSPS